MKRDNIFTAVMAALFVVGCVVAATTTLLPTTRRFQQWKAEPSPAVDSISPVAVRPQQWEYSVFWPKDEPTLSMTQIMAKLDEMGDQGWELVSVNAHNGSWLESACYIFKRRK